MCSSDLTEIRFSAVQIKRFQKNFRLLFEDNWSDCSLFEQVQNLIRPSGVECYLPLFFERTDLICDYLPDNTTYLFDGSLSDIESSFFLMVQERYHFLNKLGERPILEPSCLYASFEEIKGLSKRNNCRFICPSSKDAPGNNATSSVYRHNLSLPISAELDKTLPVLVN